ncbi:MAG TPA: zinc-binding alcohol dehydrogenase [Planctomycetota bacterium]|nr:zinc-binding alcohol dehydrogenase [Planctomycetota bacterium]
MDCAVTFTAKETAELLPSTRPADPLGADEIEGRTLASLISAGTEIEGAYRGSKFPTHPGYAAIMEVQSVGSNVKTLQPGARVFVSGGHRSWQRVAQNSAVVVPDGLAPDRAVLARLMGVSMSTLVTTAARPRDLVLITGLGLVGNLAAQTFQRCGYDVIVFDPVEARREAAKKSGIKRVLEALPHDDASIKGRVALHVECSGHEQSVLEGCKLVKRRGEVVLVGVPWRRRTEMYGFDLLHAVFHNYVVLRSGWEWEIPYSPTDFRCRSIMENYQAALRWLAEGSINTDGLVALRSPKECQNAYQDLMQQRTERPGIVFDWTQL